MKGIIYEDYLRYGCPECGCGNVTHTTNTSLGYSIMQCMQCQEVFAVLKIVRDDKTYFNNASIDVIKHPRETIPWHLYEAPDVRPEVGEYCKVRALGYDLMCPDTSNSNELSCYIKSVCAGIRITNMIIGILDKVDIDSHMDYRPTEPDKIQFKFSGSEFDIRHLEVRLLANGGVVTADILRDAKL